MIPIYTFPKFYQLMKKLSAPRCCMFVLKKNRFMFCHRTYTLVLNSLHFCFEKFLVNNASCSNLQLQNSLELVILTFSSWLGTNLSKKLCGDRNIGQPITGNIWIQITFMYFNVWKLMRPPPSLLRAQMVDISWVKWSDFKKMNLLATCCHI